MTMMMARMVQKLLALMLRIMTTIMLMMEEYMYDIREESL